MRLDSAACRPAEVPTPIRANGQELQTQTEGIALRHASMMGPASNSIGINCVKCYLLGVFSLLTAQVQAQQMPAELLSHGGLWADAQRPAQGLMIEEIGHEHLAVTWFTWAPASDAAPGPRWYSGLGTVDDGLASIDLVEVTGGVFAVPLRSQVRHVPWGHIDIAFAGEHAQMHYSGPPGYGQGRLSLSRIVEAGLGLNDGISIDPPLLFDFGRTGTYYDPLQGAGGWTLLQYVGEGSRYAADDYRNVPSLLTWFTWDEHGSPVWMYGIDDSASDGLVFDMKLPTAGGRFEAGPSLSQITFTDWGSVKLEGEACGDGLPGLRVSRMGRDAALPRFTDGSASVVRLTQPYLANVWVGC